MYQVILVDDEQMIINSLLFGHDWAADGFEVVATTTSSAEALRLIAFIRPDVVFTDIRMPGMDGLELMERLHRDFPQTKLVVISGYSEFEYAQRAIAAGAIGYCLKPLENDEISEALSKAKKGLDENKRVVQSAFYHLMNNPGSDSSKAFMETVFSKQRIPQTICAALCCGSADSVLTGCASYLSLEVGDNCRLYLIVSNAAYLTSVPFRSSLLKAASSHKLRSFVWINVTDCGDFLEKRLMRLFDQCYAWFMTPEKIAIDPVCEPLPGNPAALDNIKNLANKDRLVELESALASLDKTAPPLTAAQAVELYNLCMILLYRAENAESPSPQPIRFIYELAELYDSFPEMLQVLMKRLSRLYGKVNTDAIHNDTLRSIIRYLDGNFTEKLSFQDICSEYGINSSYLSQLFKRELNMTFTGYVTDLRISYAKELLENTSLLVSEVGERVGYDNYFHFTKLFKKETGCSPTQYRDSYGTPTLRKEKSDSSSDRIV